MQEELTAEQVVSLMTWLDESFKIGTMRVLWLLHMLCHVFVNACLLCYSCDVSMLCNGIRYVMLYCNYEIYYVMKYHVRHVMSYEIMLYYGN